MWRDIVVVVMVCVCPSIYLVRAFGLYSKTVVATIRFTENILYKIGAFVKMNFGFWFFLVIFLLTNKHAIILVSRDSVIKKVIHRLYIYSLVLYIYKYTWEQKTTVTLFTFASADACWMCLRLSFSTTIESPHLQKKNRNFPLAPKTCNEIRYFAVSKMNMKCLVHQFFMDFNSEGVSFLFQKMWKCEIISV